MKGEIIIWGAQGEKITSVEVSVTKQSMCTVPDVPMRDSSDIDLFGFFFSPVLAPGLMQGMENPERIRLVPSVFVNVPARKLDDRSWSTYLAGVLRFVIESEGSSGSLNEAANALTLYWMKTGGGPGPAGEIRRRRQPLLVEKSKRIIILEGE